MNTKEQINELINKYGKPLAIDLGERISIQIYGDNRKRITGVGATIEEAIINLDKQMS